MEGGGGKVRDGGWRGGERGVEGGGVTAPSMPRSAYCAGVRFSNFWPCRSYCFRY